MSALLTVDAMFDSFAQKLTHPVLTYNCLYVIDKSIIMWKLTRDETNYGIPQRSLKGHSHFVSDVVISSDGQFALSGAWDGTLRLWDLTT